MLSRCEDWVFQVKAMKPQEVAQTWAEYLSAMMRQLTTAQTGSAEAASLAEKRISELIQEVIPLPPIRRRQGHEVVLSEREISHCKNRKCRQFIVDTLQPPYADWQGRPRVFFRLC